MKDDHKIKSPEQNDTNEVSSK